MKIGVPKEIKNHEYRVGLTPESVAALTQDGHTVAVETAAGLGIGVDDAAYKNAGGKIVKTAMAVFDFADLVVKVKEPLAAERRMLRRGQTLFTYLHLAADKTLTRELMKSGAVCIAYETISSDTGGLPLLHPMSQVAGRLSAQAVAYYLQKPKGGIGKFIGGVPGVPAAKVVIIGGGVVGRNAARVARGMGARVWVLEKNARVMDAIDAEFRGEVTTLYSSPVNLAREVTDADGVIGGILIPGEAAPKLLSEAMIRTMRRGSVVVDVAIDQGGCFATSRPTTHDEPIYIKHGVVHYCVTNMPGSVPHTATYALNNVTLPFVRSIAGGGWQAIARADAHFAAGVSVVDGALTCPHSAHSLRIRHTPLGKFLG